MRRTVHLVRCQSNNYYDHGVMTDLPATEDFGPKMLACTEKERRFVWAYLMNGGNGTKAARAAGYSDKSEACKVRAHGLLHKDRVLEALHEVSWKTLRGLSLVATLKAEKILKAKDHPDLAKMIFGVWSRTGFAEKTVHENHTTVEVSHTDATLDALAWMKSMEVPRAKLIEHFGYSGLPRYERMLEEREARRGMKVVDGRID